MKHWLFLLFLVVCKLVSGQNKVGIVDSQSLLERLPSRVKMIELIKEREAVLLEELTELDSSLYAMYDRMVICHRNVNLMTSLYEKNKLERLQKDIREKEQEWDDKMEYWMSESNNKSMKIIRQAVKKVSLNLGLDVVLDKTQLMYVADELNITELVFLEMVKIDQSTE